MAEIGLFGDNNYFESKNQNLNNLDLIDNTQSNSEGESIEALQDDQSSIPQSDNSNNAQSEIAGQDRLSAEARRILQVMQHENMNLSQFAQAIGVKISSISHIVKGRNNPSLDIMQRVLRRFDYLSAQWLILGIGEQIFSSPTAKDSNEIPFEIHQSADDNSISNYANSTNEASPETQAITSINTNSTDLASDTDSISDTDPASDNPTMAIVQEMQSIESTSNTGSTESPLNNQSIDSVTENKPQEVHTENKAQEALIENKSQEVITESNPHEALIDKQSENIIPNRRDEQVSNNLVRSETSAHQPDIDEIADKVADRLEQMFSNLQVKQSPNSNQSANEQSPGNNQPANSESSPNYERNNLGAAVNNAENMTTAGVSMSSNSVENVENRPANIPQLFELDSNKKGCRVTKIIVFYSDNTFEQFYKQ